MIYRCTFSRVGRNHNVPPQIFEAADAEELAGQIHQLARKHLGSREVEVVVDLDVMLGMILVGGFRPAGDFTIEMLAPVG